MALDLGISQLSLTGRQQSGASVEVIGLSTVVPADSAGAPLIADVTAETGWLAGATVPFDQTFNISVSGLNSASVTLTAATNALSEVDDWSSLLAAGLVGDTYFAVSEVITLTVGGEDVDARLVFDVSGQTSTAIELDFKTELAALSVGAIPINTSFTASTTGGTRPWETLTGNVSRLATTASGEIVTVDTGALGEAMIGWADFPGTERIFDVGTTGTAIRLRSYLSGALDQTFTIDVSDWVAAGDKFYQVVLGVSDDGSTLLAQITNSQDETRYGTWSLWPLGSEDLPNGDFDSSANWTFDSNWSIGSGKATADGTSDGDLDGDVSLTPGMYAIFLETSDYVSGRFRVEFRGDGAANVGDFIESAGTHLMFLECTGNHDVFRLNVAGTNYNGSVDNISLKKVTSQDNGLARPRALTLGTGLGSASQVTAIQSVNGLSTRTTNAFDASTGALFTPFDDDPARPEVLKTSIASGSAGHADINNTGLPPASRGPIGDATAIETAVGTPDQNEVVTVDLSTHFTEDSNDPIASYAVDQGSVSGSTWTVGTSASGSITAVIAATTERGVSISVDVDYTVSVAAVVDAPAFTSIPGVSSATVLAFTAPDGADLTSEVLQSPTLTGSDVYDPADLDSGPVHTGPGGAIEGGVNAGSTLKYTPPITATKAGLASLQIPAQFYLGGVAQGSVVTFLGSSEPGTQVLEFDRPADDTSQIEVRGNMTDSNGSRAFDTVIAETTVIPATPPVAEDKATFAIAGGSAATINLLGSSSGAITGAVIQDDGVGIISNVTSTGCDYTPPATVSGSYEDAVIEFVIEASGAQVVEGEVRIVVHAAAATVGVGEIEAEAFNFDGYVTIIDDATVSGSQYSQGNPLGKGASVASFTGPTGNYDLTVHYRTDDRAGDLIELFVDDVSEWSYDGDGVTRAWVTATIANVAIANGDELRFEQTAVGPPWAKVDKLVIATHVSVSYPDFGEILQSSPTINGPGATLSATPTSGNIIFLMTTEDNGGAVTLPAGYTQISDVQDTSDASLDPRMVTAYKVSDGTETGDQAISMVGSGSRSHIVAELDAELDIGGATLSLVQQVTASGAGSATVNLDTGDTARAIAIVAVGYARQSAITGFTVSAGWTEIENAISGSNNAPAVLLFAKELPSGGTDSFTFTATTGNNSTRGTVVSAAVIRGI